ncbi:hypothetical protein [Streptomyces sp. NPDC060054]|uniref:hypothetical protein n=1 Tax=Streptomyces sp. NPDC060054 TaxID=3347048 RepID=UPI0036B5083D
MTDLTLFSDTPPVLKEPTASVVHGTIIISSVETAWKEICRRFPGVPDISVTTPPSTDTQDPTKCAALRTGRHFIRDGSIRVELQVSSGALGFGGRAMLEGLLHHAAHGLALSRNIKDTTSNGRYHNKRYANLAREVGLTPPASSAPVLGLTRCSLDDSELLRWADVVAVLDAAAAVQLEATVQAVGAPRRGRTPPPFRVMWGGAPHSPCPGGAAPRAPPPPPPVS